MSDRISRTERVCCCVLTLVTWLILVPASVLSQSMTPQFVITEKGGVDDLTVAERSNIRSFIDLDALSLDDNERAYGLIGMPVRVNLRIQNGVPSYNDAEPPRPVAVISNWMDQVKFDLMVPGGTIISNVAAQFMPYANRFFKTIPPGESAESLLGLRGHWVINQATIGCVEGDYVVSARWRGVKCGENRTVTVRAPAGDVENGKIRLAKARVMQDIGAVENAIREYDAIILEHGKTFEYNKSWVLERKARALCLANRLEEALAVFQECREIVIKKTWKMDGTGANRPPTHLDMIIQFIEARIARARNGTGASNAVVLTWGYY